MNKINKQLKKPQVATLKTNKKSKNNKLPFAIIIGIVTTLVYFNITQNSFLNWDDNLFVTENIHIRDFSIANVKHWFTNNYVSNYLPLTIFSFAINYKFAALNATAYTVTNLLLHIINALLVFWLVFKICKVFNSSISGQTNNSNKLSNSIIIACFTALLFAIHPFNVESVAWISERKNLLFTSFFLLSLIVYVKYLFNNNKWYYAIAFILFLCSLLSKGVAVSLSLCLVAVDYLFKRNLLSKKVILEKIPFFILSLIFGLIAIKAQQHENALVGAVNNPFLHQLAFASYGFIMYLIKLFVPFNLSAYYSYPPTVFLVHWLSLLLTICLFVALFIFRNKIPRLIVFGILFYIANLIFLIQLIPVGNAIMADRYIYVSSIGFFMVMAILVTQIANKYKITYVLLAGALLLYGINTSQRVKNWNNSMAFWDDVIAHDQNIPRAWNNRGVLKKEKTDYAGAIIDFNQALKLIPNYAEAFNNRGIALFYQGKTTEALFDFDQAIIIDSVYADALYNRGTVREKVNNLQGALTDLNKAIELNPNKIEAYVNRANVYIKLNIPNMAITDCKKVINLGMGNANVNAIIASAYYMQGNYTQSINYYTTAIQFDATNINYFHNRGAAYYYNLLYTNAIADMDIVLQNNPNLAISHYIRGMALIKIGNKQLGCTNLNTAYNLGLTAASNDINIFCK